MNNFVKKLTANSFLNKKPTKADEVLNRLGRFILLITYPSLLKYFWACARAALPILNIAQLAAIAIGATTTITRQSIIFSLPYSY